ncbi:MAG: esterase/lipase family protein [Gammaproteobacteria bacterium]
MPLPYPVIVVPGITASYLRDQYPISPETVWSVLTREYERAALHPDDLRYEAMEPARLLPDQVFEIAYRELIEELRYNLRRKEDQPVPVYPFPYDWRQPLEHTSAQLGDFIKEVIDRTKLMRHYHKETANDAFIKNPKVNLVGHSMGGLVIAGTMAQRKADARVNRIATLATPFQGSYEAVIKVITGTANLGTSAPSSRERESARLTPALYHLLPRFEGAVTGEADGVSTNLFDSAAWQSGVRDSISEFVRLHGVNPGKRTAQAAELFKGMLGTANEFLTALDGFQLADADMTEKNWLVVAGVDTDTRVRLRSGGTPSAPEFLLSNGDRMNHWRDGDSAAERRLTGDGTVPFNGAIPPFMDLSNVVCVTPDDYGYWELQDRATTKAAGFHGILPNMNMLHRMLVRFFTGAPDRRGNTWGRPAPGVSPGDWAPALSLSRSDD